jgi:hypothetical protein
MKIQSRAARVFIVALISLNLTVAVAAQPRERDHRVPPGIEKILKKIVKIFTITTNDAQPIPPRP